MGGVDAGAAADCHNCLKTRKAQHVTDHLAVPGDVLRHRLVDVFRFDGMEDGGSALLQRAPFLVDQLPFLDGKAHEGVKGVQFRCNAAALYRLPTGSAALFALMRTLYSVVPDRPPGRSFPR